ncbi:MAG: amino acid ABC transporter substrate-binding protein [bacterium]|nr:amino acid ABC transporter substrate-binding protein [bacterium]
MLEDPVSFTGPKEGAGAPAESHELFIGLFAPGGGDPVSTAMNQGAQLAVEHANSDGGVNGVPVRLVQRWADNPWSAGAREVVRLVYEDQVRALVGSVDSASTHIAEQVATKARIPLVSPLATDPSLTQARIPWIFRLPPDDDRQADILVEQGIQRFSFSRPALVTGTDHQGRVASEALLKALKQHGRPPRLHLTVPVESNSIEAIVARLVEVDPDAVVLHLPPQLAKNLLAAFALRATDCVVFLPWIAGLNANEVAEASGFEILTLIPLEEAASPIDRRMRNDYHDRWGLVASPTAVLAYDAVTLIVNALRQSGPDRVDLRDAIARSTWHGAGGPITWDNGGGNTNQPTVKHIRGK